MIVEEVHVVCGLACDCSAPPFRFDWRVRFGQLNWEGSVGTKSRRLKPLRTMYTRCNNNDRTDVHLYVALNGPGAFVLTYLPGDPLAPRIN